jgi:putative heme-binding domain-containing protein
MSPLKLLLAPLLAVSFAYAQTPPEELKVPPGFKVELLRSAGKDEGSWVAMAIDAKGRLYLSPQGTVPSSGFKKEDAWGGLWRATLNDKGHLASLDKVPVPVGNSMGMLWAFDSLYVSGQGPEGQAIYRLRDTNGDDTLDGWTLFKKVPGGGGEHGAHALVLGPDEKSIYIAHGNSTPLVEGTDPGSPYRHYAEDRLLPRVLDPVATFFDKLKAPYGYVLRTDENGAKWELFAGGFRNQYDIDFNADGELFTYDSDMEWDVGLPWYRPTRVLHVVSGGEYGFREGNEKWPEHYEDSLPAAVNIGLGCPTGVKFGTKSRFPEKYQRAFFMMDWTFGRILAVHLRANGSTYTAKNPLKSYTHPTGPEASEDVEVFLQGKGMPVTDLEFGLDGAMYLTVGGRGTQGALYRVSWTGNQESRKVGNQENVELQRRIREFPQSAELAMALLSQKPDRFNRFASRLALEAAPVAQWRDRAFSEKDPQAALTALLALARVGAKEDQAPLLKALAQFPLDSLSDELKLLKLRVITLSFIRQGRPSDELVKLAIEKLDRQYPAKTFALNRELAPLLVWLDSPDVVEKTLALLASAPSQEEQVWYACALREAKQWTSEQRQRYFAWFAKAQSYKGGNSFAKFILRIRDQALAKVIEADRPALLELAEKKSEPPQKGAPVVARQFQKAWTLADLEPELANVARGRNFQRGREIYAAAQCASCHLFAGDGGTVGPDLTAAAGRFSRRDILDAIIDPSKALSEQYASFLLTLKDGSIVGGLIADENNDHYAVLTDPINGTKQIVGRTQVVSKELSPVSMMPPGLLYSLTKDEILDLLAYLESGGNEKAPAFAKP